MSQRVRPEMPSTSTWRRRGSLLHVAVIVAALVPALALWAPAATAAPEPAPSPHSMTAADLAAAAVSEETWMNLRVSSSNKCLDVTGGTGATGDGVRIQQWTCLGGGQTNQIWKLHRVAIASTGAVLFQVIAKHSNLCLDVTGGTGATGNGVPVQQFECRGLGQWNQLWYLTSYNGGATYNLRAWHSDKCLDVTGGPAATGDGVRLQQWDCLGAAQSNQLWHQTTP